MNNTIGQSDVQVMLRVCGDEFEVMTSKEAAKKFEYCQEHICRLCDEGTLLSWKIAGVWWIASWQFDVMRND